MRVVTLKRLTEFSTKHPQSKIPLLYWYELVKDANWKNLADIKEDFNTVDYVGNNRNTIKLVRNKLK